MQKIYRIATPRSTSDSDNTEPQTNPASPTILNRDQSLGDACSESWVDLNEELTQTSTHADDSMPNTDPASSNVSFNDGSQCLDTTTFPSHAVQFLPSEVNGTWRLQAIKHPSGTVSTVREVLAQHAHELNVPVLLQKLEQVAENGKDAVEGWLNRTLSDTDLVQMHGRLQNLVSGVSTPNMRQVSRAIDKATDTVTEIAKTLQPRRSGPNSVNAAFASDKYTFARIVGKNAREALVEQGICEDWQLLTEEYTKLHHSMQSALVHTFERLEQVRVFVPDLSVKPQWVADQGAKVWRLELDIGKVDVEVGPAHDVSLVELGPLDTGFCYPKSCGPLDITVTNFEQRALNVEDEWDLVQF